MAQGKVMWFSEKNGNGFIEDKRSSKYGSVTEFGNTWAFRTKDVNGDAASLQSGQTVSFDAPEGIHYATNVTPA